MHFTTKIDLISILIKRMLSKAGTMLLRKRLAIKLDPMLKSSPGLSILNKVIIFVILFSLFLAIIETESTIISHHEKLFFIMECIITVIFIIEYAMRIWVCVENPQYPSRIHYLFSLTSLIDLVAILLILLTTVGSESFLLRLGRIMRVLMLAKLGRYSAAMKNIGYAVYRRRFELIISFFIGVVALILSSSLLYIVEGNIQPEHFGSIPRAMWWSIATLTTVGYGDVYPITALGKFFGAITALVGIGLIAMPTGILAASFSDAIQTIKNKNKKD